MAKRNSESETARVVGRLAPAKVAAREYGIPYTTLRDRVLSGELPVVKLGSAWYFDRRDLDRFIERAKERVPA